MNSQCKICGQPSHHRFTAEILNKYSCDYFQCSACGFLQTEPPYWLDEAYLESINRSDTGYMTRNLTQMRKLTVLLWILFKGKGKYLDYAAGYGVFCRLMRDVGLEFYWDDQYTENLFAKGFEWDSSTPITAVTAFECFEHFPDPRSSIDELFNISDTIIFSTELYPDHQPSPSEWWYYALDHGQHVAFYTEEALQHIAKEKNTNYYRFGSLHVFTLRSLPKYTRFALKAANNGLFYLLNRRFGSKTWPDYLAMSQKK